MRGLGAAFAQDLRPAARGLLRAPLFTGTALLVLALAIGAATAVFSLVDAVLIRPMPVEDQRRLVVIWSSDPERDVPLVEISYPDYLDIRRDSRAFSDVAAHGSVNWTRVLTGAGDPVSLPFAAVSGSFFHVLGAQPALGRPFTASDDLPGAVRVVVVSHRFWQERFGGRADVLGQIVTLDRQPFTIAGVMGAAFDYPAGAQWWEPLVPYLQSTVAPASLEQLRGIAFLYMVARLAPGRTIESARQDTTSLIRALHERYERRLFGQAVVSPLTDHVLGATRPALVFVAVAICLVVALACANVAGLLLVRVSARARELSIRQALGAPRARLMNLVIGECVLLGGAAAAGAAIVARWTLRTLVAAMPAGLPGVRGASIDRRALAIGFAATLLCAIAVSLAPLAAVVRLSRGNELQRRAGFSGNRAQTHGRQTLIAAEVALTVALLVNAALAVRSFVNLQTMDLGFTPARALVVRTSASEAEGPLRRRLFAQTVEQRLSRLPGVVAAGAASQSPLELGPIGEDLFVQREGQMPAEARHNPFVSYVVATPGYFAAMRIRLLAGRAFTSHDDASSPPVAMVSASTASRLWPGSQAVGRRMRLFRGGGNPWITVVGVVANTRTRQLRETLLDVYVPASQTDTGVPAWIVRTTDDPLREGTAIRAAIRQVDPTRAVDISTLERRVEDAMRPWRFATLVLGAFAALALALAVTGVHGLLAYSVLLQQKEFGIRVALGAAPRRIAAIIARRVALVTMAGIVAGVPLAFAGARAMTGLLFGVTPLDVTSLAAAVIVLGAAVAVAAAAPAHRAASADPIVALRETL